MKMKKTPQDVVEESMRSAVGNNGYVADVVIEDLWSNGYGVVKTKASIVKVVDAVDADGELRALQAGAKA